MSLSEYKSFLVDPLARVTSAGPGDGCLSVADGISVRKVSAHMPNYYHSAIVHKISKELQCSFDDATDILKEASNFLWMSAHASHACVPSPILDEGWHVFILFTQEYMEFCDEYCGGYMHHVPHVGEDTRLSVDFIRETADLCHKVFGAKPSTNWDYVDVKSWMSEHSVAA